MRQIGLGCMGMSGMYGASDDAESMATIQAAIDQGVKLIDTGDFYGMGHNEMLIGKAIAGRRSAVELSVKFGAMRTPEGGWTGIDVRPAAVKNFVAYSLKRLSVDYIDIYRPARFSGQGDVPIEDTVGAVADLIRAGYVRKLGLSEVGVDLIRRAHAVTPVADLQIEYSLVSRGPEAGIFPVLEALGIGVTAYGVLSRGLLSGSRPTGSGDFRAYLPRFSGASLEQNLKLVAELEGIAKEHGRTATQIAIAWVMAKGERILPVIGARKRAQLAEALLAMEIELTEEEMARIEARIPAEAVAGTRYDEHQMAMLDSERKSS